MLDRSHNEEAADAHGVELARPAGFEPAATGLEARRKEATGGSGTPLPQCFRASVDRPRPLEHTSSRRELSAVCQPEPASRAPCSRDVVHIQGPHRVEKTAMTSV